LVRLVLGNPEVEVDRSGVGVDLNPPGAALRIMLEAPVHVESVLPKHPRQPQLKLLGELGQRGRAEGASANVVSQLGLMPDLPLAPDPLHGLEARRGKQAINHDHLSGLEIRRYLSQIEVGVESGALPRVVLGRGVEAPVEVVLHAGFERGGEVADVGPLLGPGLHVIHGLRRVAVRIDQILPYMDRITM